MTARVPRDWRTDGERRMPRRTRSAVRHPTGGWRGGARAASFVDDGGKPEQLDVFEELDAAEGFDDWDVFDTPDDGRRVNAEPRELERDFQGAVIEAARLSGWRVAHFRPARTRHGWRTPVAADGAGFPDLLLVRGAQLVAAELKSARGKVTPEQADWLDALDGAGVAVYVWKPADWDEVVTTLTAETAA